MYQLVEKILWAVSFIAIGGTITIMFFFVFAQSIVGSRTTQSQLARLLELTEQIQKQLVRISDQLQKEDRPQARS